MMYTSDILDLLQNSIYVALGMVLGDLLRYEYSQEEKEKEKHDEKDQGSNTGRS